MMQHCVVNLDKTIPVFERRLWWRGNPATGRTLQHEGYILEIEPGTLNPDQPNILIDKYI